MRLTYSSSLVCPNSYSKPPAGYIMDYTDYKVAWLAFASITTTCLTLLTAMTAQEYGANLGWMIFLKFIQGGVTALIPPGLNSITQGIVGADGMTRQVSNNEMRNHFGTAVIVLTGSLMAFFMYPEIGMLFLVSPVACVGVIFFLLKINPKDIDHDAARGLIKSDSSNGNEPVTEYTLSEDGSTGATGSTPVGQKMLGAPSFNFGGENAKRANGAESPLTLLKDTTLLTFIIIVFLFHMSNGTVFA